MILPYGHIRASNCESVETVGRNGWPYDEIRSLFVREYLHNLEPFIKRENSVSPPSPPGFKAFFVEALFTNNQRQISYQKLFLKALF